MKTKGLKLLNRGKFKTSLWIINIVKKEEYNLKNVQLPIRLSIISVKQLGFNKPTQLKKKSPVYQSNLNLFHPTLTLKLV